MGNESGRFQAAVERFDAANAEDPSLEVEGDSRVPSELAYARRMTKWLEALYPAASEALRLAARSQHLRRWMIPRDTYPATRAGYHRWRTALGAFHADEAAKVLRDAGYDEPTVARVGSLLRKERLKDDPDAQALEDVACLVFLEFEFAGFAPKHGDEKVVGILRRTWAKMSPVGHAAALKLELPEGARRLVQKALAGE